jgi:uracil-DNA glycosylase
VGDPNTLARLVRQHAETSRLLGVDFVPRYSRDRAGSGEAEPAGEAPTTVVSQRVETSQPASKKVTSIEVVKPATPKVSSVIEMKQPRIEKSKDRAASQQLLDALRVKYEADAPHKTFATTFTNIVFGEGDPCARLMFVGEAPGADEDRTGRPFVGRAGELLNKMIIAMGLKREDVYIANVLKTRPIDNATPTPKEVEACAPYLWEQIRIVSPEAIVTLGLPASRCLLKSEESMGQLRAKWASFECTDGRKIPVMPTYHPAFILRAYTPENRAKVWSDLQMVMERLGMIPPVSASA